MVVFSTLRLSVSRKVLFNLGQKPSAVVAGNLVRRQMGSHGHARKFVIEPSNYPFFKFLDQAHWYSFLALVFYGSIILYCNVFIGDAELREIPEGYVPKYWEYHHHPISRWFAWVQGDPQKYYENFLHHMYHEYWDMVYTDLEQKVKFEIKKNKDYKAYYYQAISANSLRHFKENNELEEQEYGLNPHAHSFPWDFKDEEGNWPAKPLE